MTSIGRFLRNKWVVPADPQDKSFAGQTILVTGANTGLGFNAAIKFARQGAARLILAVRNADRGTEAQKKIQQAAADAGNNSIQVDVWIVDMESPPSVQALARRAADELPGGLHAAVLNAGVWKSAYARVEETGWEQTLQVNTLSTVLLALLLLPVCARARTEDFRPTLEMVSSGVHYMHVLDPRVENGEAKNILAWYNDEANWRGGSHQYGGSKLLLMYALPGLTQAGGDKVWVTTVCPGACESDLSRDLSTLPFRLAKLALRAIFLRTTEEGSRTLVSGIGLGQTGHGEFWQNDEIREPAPLVCSQTGKRLQPKVWAEMQAVLEEQVPEVKAAIKL